MFFLLLTQSRDRVCAQVLTTIESEKFFINFTKLLKNIIIIFKRNDTPLWHKATLVNSHINKSLM